jgi:hypothetical protein
MEQPFSQSNPKQPQGIKQGAPHLQQHSQLTQQTPTLPLQPGQSQPVYKPQLIQGKAQHKTMSSASTASPQQHMMMMIEWKVSVEEVERGCFLPCMIPSCVPRKRKNEV